MVEFTALIEGPARGRRVDTALDALIALLVWGTILAAPLLAARALWPAFQAAAWAVLALATVLAVALLALGLGLEQRRARRARRAALRD